MTAGAEPEVPPPVAMLRTITGYWVTQAIGVVSRLGIPDQLVLVGGRERTEEQYRRLRLERIIPTQSAFSEIEATRL
jgi:hypothetical protein